MAKNTKEKKEKKQEIKIPRHMLVRCPKKRFDFRTAVHCENCEYVLGLNERDIQNPNANENELPFQAKYSIACGYPISRELFVVRTD